ncbi:hypothetical protein LP420_05910 [Massilia sp. B-10]|nr:hypothetical protein LP420_05910 [Massilia sp. B-10]
MPSEAAPRAKPVFRLVDASSLVEPGMADSATRVFGYPGKRMGLDNVAPPHTVNLYELERETRNNRAWGLSVGIKTGLLTLRAAHQNKSVGKIASAMPLGNSIDAKNSIIAANIDIGRVKAYTAYSASRGWGSSPLWNPDNPYGAAMAATPSTDSRDVLVGVAVLRPGATRRCWPPSCAKMTAICPTTMRTSWPWAARIQSRARPIFMPPIRAFACATAWIRRSGARAP